MSADGVGPKGSVQKPGVPENESAYDKSMRESNEGKEDKKEKSDPVKAPVGDKEVDFKNISLEEAFDILKV